MHFWLHLWLWKDNSSLSSFKGVCREELLSCHFVLDHACSKVLEDYHIIDRIWNEFSWPQSLFSEPSLNAITMLRENRTGIQRYPISTISESPDKVSKLVSSEVLHCHLHIVAWPIKSRYLICNRLCRLVCRVGFFFQDSIVLHILLFPSSEVLTLVQYQN